MKEESAPPKMESSSVSKKKGPVIGASELPLRYRRKAMTAEEMRVIEARTFTRG